MTPKSQFKPLNALLPVAFLLAVSCAAPRAQTQSGRVVADGAYRAGGNMTINISSSTLKIIEAAESAGKAFVDSSENGDDSQYSEATKDLTTAVVAYGLDPVGTGMDFYARYGVYDRVDVGYKWASGVHVFDGRFQFLGPVAGKASEPDKFMGAFYGNIGLQFSSQTYELPSLLGLDKLGAVLGLEFSRKDFLVPVTFSHSLGKDEKYGALSYGTVYGYTMVDYGLSPSSLVDAAGIAIPGISKSQSFSSFGAFVNGKFGFKYAYLLVGLSAYYQDFGTFEMLEQETAELSSFTVIPSFGIELDLD